MIILYYITLHYTILYYIIWYYMIWYIWYDMIWYDMILYYIILYYITYYKRAATCFNHYTAIFGPSKHVTVKYYNCIHHFKGQTDTSWLICHCTFDFYTSGRSEDDNVMAETCGRAFMQYNMVRCAWWYSTQ